MKEQKISSGQEVLIGNLNDMQINKEDEIKYRQNSFVSNGIVEEIVTPFLITNTSSVGTARINVGSGVGYYNGERIEVTPATAYTYPNVPTLPQTGADGPSTLSPDGITSTPIATPQSTGSVYVTVATGTWYVGIKYLQTCDFTKYSLHPKTGRRIYYDWGNGYEVKIHSSPGALAADSCLYLGRIVVVSPLINTIDMTGRTYARIDGRFVNATPNTSSKTTVYSDAVETTVKDHIKALGTGIVSPANPHAISVADITGLSDTKNILINGGMEINQRVCSTANIPNPADNVYTLDRYVVTKTPGMITSAANIDQDLAVKRSNSSYSMKIQISSSDGAPFSMVQRIENYLDYADTYLSLSIWVYYLDASPGDLMIYIDDGDVSAPLPTSVLHGGTGWERLTVTKKIISVPTKLYVYVLSLINSTVGTYYIDNAMLVTGTTPVDFVPTNPAEDLANCQRYYEKSYAIGVAPGTSSVNGYVYQPGMFSGAAGNYNLPTVIFKVTKRQAPAVHCYDVSAVTPTIDAVEQPSGVVGVLYANESQSGFYAYRGLGFVVEEVLYHWTADAEVY